MENRLTVTASPHIQDRSSTRGLMGSVVVALLPCVAASALIFGWRALLVVGITTAASVGFEYLYCLLMKKPIPVGDLSAVVTGIILGLNMPVGIPLWIAIIGAFIAIVIAKQLFGGIGFNFANPALDKALGVFLPLIVVNCIILGRAEMFASKNKVLDSAIDGLGMGLGFTLTLVVMGSIREIIGAGSWFGMTIIPESVERFTFMTTPAGGFFTFGILMALVIFIENKTGNKKKRSVGCEGCPSQGACGAKGGCE